MTTPPISSPPRKEAGPLSAANLSGPQEEALERLLALVNGHHGSPDLPAPEEPDYLARIEDERRSNSFLIDGPRGTGKSSLLLTALQTWRDAWPQPNRARTRKRPADPLPRAVLPLPILDLSTLEPGVTLDLLLAARLRSLVVELDRGAASGAHDQQRTIEDDWDTFVALAAGQGAGREVLGGGSALERAEDLRRLATEGIHRADHLGRLMRALRKAAEVQWGVDLLLVVTVDDADVQPARVDELLRTLRVLHHPRLVFVVAGDMELFHHAVCNKLAHDLPKVTDSFYLSRLTAQVLERIFPANQRLAVRHLSRADRMRLFAGASLDAKTDGPSLKDMLDRVQLKKLDPLSTLLEDPDLELWKGLPDRLRTLVDLQLALQRHLRPDPDDPKKLIIRPWDALRCLWEASIDLRESDPSARDHIRRSLDLYWVEEGQKPLLRLWDFSVSWTFRELTSFAVDKPEDALMARRIVIRVPDRPTLRLQGSKREHPLSETLAWLFVLTVDIAVDQGWVSDVDVKNFWPIGGWISCHAHRDDGADDKFDWPALSLNGHCRGSGRLRTLLNHTFPAGEKDFESSPDYVKKIAEAYFFCLKGLLILDTKQAEPENNLLSDSWLNPRRERFGNLDDEADFKQLRLVQFGLDTPTDPSVWIKTEAVKLEVWLQRNVRSANPALLCSAFDLWAVGRVNNFDRRMVLAEEFRIQWPPQAMMDVKAPLAFTLVSSEFARQLVVRTSEKLWTKIKDCINDGFDDVKYLVPVLSETLPPQEQNARIVITVNCNAGPQMEPWEINSHCATLPQIGPDAVLIALLHESTPAIPWTPKLQMQTNRKDCSWPVPNMKNIMGFLVMSQLWQQSITKSQPIKSSRVPNDAEVTNNRQSDVARQWIRWIIDYFKNGPRPIDPHAHEWRMVTFSAIPADWENLCITMKKQSKLEPSLAPIWADFLSRMHLFTRPEAGLPETDRAIIAEYFPPPTTTAPTAP
jgi:hypothetical protein